MNKLFLIGFLCIIGTGLKAQAVWDIDSTITPWDVKMDSIFQNVDLNRMHTNMLLNKGFIARDPLLHNGILCDSTVMDKFKYQGLYYTLFSSQTDTNIFLPYDSVETIMLLNTNYHSTSISLLAMDYDRVKPHAVDSGLLTTNGLYLFDPLIPPTESPFEKMKMFAASVQKQYFDTLDIAFAFPTSLIFTNYGVDIVSIHADFGDGNGYVVISPGNTYNIHYDSTGIKNITFKITLFNSAVLYSETRIRIRKTSPRGYSDFYVSPSSWTFPLIGAAWGSEIGIPSNSAVGYITVALGCGHSALTKPFIVVPGIDHPQLVELNGEEDETVISFLNKLPLNLYRNLEAEGFDLIYINYSNGADYIQRNARLVETVIRWANDEKAANGSTEPNVVYGVSMGGIVAKYALLHMEDNSETHDVTKFITHDSPHNGANIPMGAQAMLEHFYKMNITYRIMGAPVFQHKLYRFIPEIILAEGMMGNPASLQLLIHSIYSWDLQSEHSLRTALIAEIDGWGGWPTQINTNGIQIENIAICNGSGNGSAGNQGFNAQERMVKVRAPLILLPLPFFVSPFMPITHIGFITATDIWAMPGHHPTNKYKVYSGKVYAHLNISGLSATIISVNDFSVRGVYDIDNAPGGFYDINEHGNLNLPGVEIDHPRFCFVPSISSSSLVSPFNGNNNIYSNVNSFWNTGTNAWTSSQSPIDRFVSGWQNDIGTNPENQGHTDFNEPNIRYFLANVVGDPLFPHDFPLGGNPSILSNSLSNEVFNLGGNSSTRISSTQIKYSGSLQINTDNPIGLASATMLGNPVTGSDFTAWTNGTNCKGPVVIDVLDSGSVIIGDNSVGNTGKLIIEEGDILRLRSGSTLVINNGSTLVIKKGATLKYDAGAAITLQGTAAIIDLSGTLEIGAGATFTFDKGTASDGGEIRVKAIPDSSNGQFRPMGANAEIALQGDGQNDVILTIEGDIAIEYGFTDPSYYFSAFSLLDGKVTYGANSSIRIAYSVPTITVNNISFEATVLRANNIGLITEGQSAISITNSTFSDLETGLKNLNPNNGNMLDIEYCTFSNCGTGINNVNAHIYVFETYFNTSDNEGVLLDNPTNDCKFENCRFYSGNTGIRTTNTNSTWQNIFIENCWFSNNDIGCDMEDVYLTTSCSRFLYNSSGLRQASGEINISTTKLTTTGNIYSTYGGYNTFGYNVKGMDLDDYLMLFLDEGYNNFIHDVGQRPANFLFGVIGYSSITHQTSSPYPLLAGNNYWYPAPSPNLNSGTYTDYYDVRFSPPGGGGTTQNQFTGSMLSSLVTYCYDPEIVFGLVAGSESESSMPEMKNTSQLNNNLNAAKNELNIYPNPANNELYVETNSSNAIKTIIVYNMQGMKIKEINITDSRCRYVLDNECLNSGNYLIRVITEQAVYNKQFIIAR